MLQIFEHHRGTCDDDLTFFTVRQFPVGIRFDDLYVCIRERNTDTALFRHVKRCKTAGCDGLRKAVAFPDLHFRIVVTKEFIELFLQFDRHGIATGNDNFQKAEIRVFH